METNDPTLIEVKPGVWMSFTADEITALLPQLNALLVPVVDVDPPVVVPPVVTPPVVVPATDPDEDLPDIPTILTGDPFEAHPGGAVVPPVVVVPDTKPFVYSDSPNRVNRLQGQKIPPPQDNWRLKQSEIIVGGNGGMVETPDQLRERGHNWFPAQWFYGDDGKPGWGLPKATDNLFFEYTGNYFKPYHQSAFRALTHDLTAIGNNILPDMAMWNSSKENGLIDGVATVREGHFNIEYAYIELSGGTENGWNDFTTAQKQTGFYNYAIGRVETLQDCFNRGGIPALQDALFQKWRNIIGLTVLYLNASNNGMIHYWGDFAGLSRYHNLNAWIRPVSATELLAANVDNPNLFPEANETCNAGKVTVEIRGVKQTFDVSGNFNLLQQKRHCYNYEWTVSMAQKDYNAFFAITKDAPAEQKDIRVWYDRIIPDLSRPYSMAYHWLLNLSISKRKGWKVFPLDFQHETIYENELRLLETNQPVNAPWVPWTLGDKPTKIPLHPEVMKNIIFISRMHYAGGFAWGSSTRINPDAGKGENVHPNVHLVSREAEQDALSEIGKYNDTVFLADKRQHIGDIPVWNEARKSYLTGNPDQLFRAGLALVTGVDSPSSGYELYLIYFPNSKRDGTTEVKWKSPVDDFEMSATARGWGAVLYPRQRTTKS